MADTPEEELRAQFREAFEDADYPVENQMKLAAALPQGPTTRFEAGDFSMTAMEMASRLGSHQDFPYSDVDTLVDDIIEGLKAEGEL